MAIDFAFLESIKKKKIKNFKCLYPQSGLFSAIAADQSSELT